MFKRVRFLSDQTLVMPSFEETGNTPISPQIMPLELSELSDLEDLEIPPSEFFEEHKTEINTYFTENESATTTKFTFEPLERLNIFNKRSTKKKRTQSFSVKTNKKSILDFLTINKLAS